MMKDNRKIVTLSPALQEVLIEYLATSEASRAKIPAATRTLLFPPCVAPLMQFPAVKLHEPPLLTWSGLEILLIKTFIQQTPPRALAEWVSSKPMALPVLQELTKHSDYTIR